MGRPTRLTPELARAIEERVCQRTPEERLANVCRAANSGDKEAIAFILGEGHIEIRGRSEKEAHFVFVWNDHRGERMGPEAWKWRKDILARDGFKCRRCGVSANLQAHHIHRWGKNPEKRFQLENGKTLCVSCHEKCHPRYAKLIRMGHELRNRGHE